MAGADLTANDDPHPCGGATHPHAFGEWPTPTLPLRFFRTRPSSNESAPLEKEHSVTPPVNHSGWTGSLQL